MMPIAPLPATIPLLAAALLAMAGSHLPRRVVDLSALAIAVGVAVLDGCLLWHCAHAPGGQPIVYWFGGWTPRPWPPGSAHPIQMALGICFAVDAIGAGMALLVASLVACSFVFASEYFKPASSVFYTLMLLFLAAMQGFCLTGDLFNLFVFFELMSVAAYALTGLKVEEEQALGGALNFAVVNTIGSFFLLFGIALLYGRTGALNMAQIGQTLAHQPVDGLIAVAFTFITGGLLTKGAVVPMHFWLADAHAVAPTPVCVLFSGVMVELGLYGAARIGWTVFQGPLAAHTDAVRDTFLAVGALTALVGGVMCFCQRHLKRLLAFSTISHMGMFVIGVALLDAKGLAGAAIYVVGHGFVKGGLFLATGILLHRFASVDENTLRGKGRENRMIVTGLLFTFGGLGLAGLPPFGTYLGKSLIEAAAKQHGLEWVTGLFIIASMLTGAAVLRVTGEIFLGWGGPQNEQAQSPQHEIRETGGPHEHTPVTMLIATSAAIAAGLAFGCISGFSRVAEQAAHHFQDRALYAATVLALPKPSQGILSIHHESALPGIVIGLICAALAVLLALGALFQHKIPRSIRYLSGMVSGPPLALLRALHSGKVGDYVLWLVIGMTVLGGIFWGAFR